jgi:hypothetical protein
MYEAQQAYYYGLPENLAIASVTSNAANAIGLDHRVGYVKEGKLFLIIDYGHAKLCIKDTMLVSFGRCQQIPLYDIRI